MWRVIGGRGRLSVVTDDVKEVIEKTIKRTRTATAEEIANAVEEETGRRVSARTMRRVRRRLHYYPVHVSVKPALTDAHKAARLAWCREHVRDSVKSLVFMDEMDVDRLPQTTLLDQTRRTKANQRVGFC